jgi:lipopolysaccharide assembly protein A
MRVAFWLVTAVAAGVLVPFAITNRAAVSLGLWPLPFVLETPVYLLVLLILFAGLVIGGAGAWVAGHRVRRELRRQRRRVAALERELSATQAQAADRSDRAQLELPAFSTKPRGARGVDAMLTTKPYRYPGAMG